MSSKPRTLHQEKAYHHLRLVVRRTFILPCKWIHRTSTNLKKWTIFLSVLTKRKSKKVLIKATEGYGKPESSNQRVGLNLWGSGTYYSLSLGGHSICIRVFLLAAFARFYACTTAKNVNLATADDYCSTF